MKALKYLLASAVLVTIPVKKTLAAKIAIIDSGTDIEHLEIAPKAWVNENEIQGNLVDDDGDGLVDDVHGWNFAESNNLLIDNKYASSLTDDVRTYFDVQVKLLLNRATAEDKEWLKAKSQDAQFGKDLSIYGNYMHGTHVAGISIKGAKDAKVLAIKLIPTEVVAEKNAGVALHSALSKSNTVIPLVRKDNLELVAAFKPFLTKLAYQQTRDLVLISKYVDYQKMDIANGSFGVGFPQAAQIVASIYMTVVKEKPTNVELYLLTNHFVKEMQKFYTEVLTAAPNTLYVFAAGNDGLDTDKLPGAPGGIVGDTVITVAATVGSGDLASFSNYGAASVDIAAPGVAILSSVPGNESMRVSGTSQASPLVANVAGQIKDINPLLTAAQIKNILMKTVDVRAAWAKKVRSSGLLNAKRALVAAKHSLTLSLDEALAVARKEIADQKSSTVRSKSLALVKEEFIPGLVLPLPSPIILK